MDSDKANNKPYKEASVYVKYRFTHSGTNFYVDLPYDAYGNGLVIPFSELVRQIGKEGRAYLSEVLKNYKPIEIASESSSHPQE